MGKHFGLEILVGISVVAAAAGCSADPETSSTSSTSSTTTTITTVPGTPSVAIVTPAADTTFFASPVSVTGTASDSNGTISAVYVSADGLNYVLATGTTGWTASVAAGFGEVEFSAYSVDNEGHSSPTNSVRVYVFGGVTVNGTKNLLLASHGKCAYPVYASGETVTVVAPSRDQAGKAYTFYAFKFSGNDVWTGFDGVNTQTATGGSAVQTVMVVATNQYGKALFTNDTFYVTSSGTGSLTLDAGAGLTNLCNAQVVSGDLDNDGDIDLIVCGSTTSAESFWDTEIYLNDGNGAFTRSGAGSLTGVSDSGLALGDVDGDGDLDLVMMGYSSGYIAKCYLNDGTGAFSDSGMTTLKNCAYSSSSLGDFDGDGDLDLIVTGLNIYGRTTIIYTNNGSGSFGEVDHAQMQGVEQGQAILADFDGDNDLDYVVSGYTGSTLFTGLYLNDGTGVFTLKASSALTNARFSSLAAGDVDGDGDLDLILGGYTASGDATIVYLNDGLGGFTVKANTIDAIEIGSLSLGDLDGDGDLDLVLTGGSFLGSAWLNDGTGAFTKSPTIVIVGLYAGDTAFADVDGDGDLDLVESGRRSNGNPYTGLYLNE